MPSETIKVVVRAKPLLTTSKSVPWTIEENNIYERSALNEYFTFDKVFDVEQKNVDIYETIISPMVHSAIEGINLTIFAYGATSSGKTYTMNGTQNDPGVIPRIIEEIFYEIQMCSTRKFLVRVSYVEIYREIINDLLDRNNKDLKIREDINNFINYNPTEKIIKSSTECLNIMKMGNSNRTTGETLMNASSSRSHSIFRIIIESTPTSGSEQDPVQVSQVNLIDLAGSERVSQTGATGERFKEGAHINKSLTVLGLVIRQLVEKKDYISYRDSKLTRILSNSLGGNAETVIICNINLLSLEDTQSTLLFAQRAKAVKVKPKVTEIMNESSMTKKYAKECAELKILLDKELEKNKQLEQQSIMSNREISDLTSRIQSMQEVFVKKEPLKKPPKRRHTFCSIRKLSAISEEKESASTFRNSGITEELCDVHNSVEFENSLEVVPENFTDAKQDTPVKVLRERIKILGNEYDELLEFTRLEESTKCSVEEDMAQKIRMLSTANSDLRSSLKYAEKQIQKLLLENEKSKQSVNDYDYLVESQKKRYEKRVNELLDQINECNSDKSVPVQTPQIDTFEYEEMIDTIASLKKQNEKLHELVDTTTSYNANSKYLEDKNKQLLEENRSLELENSESQNKLSFFQSENVKLNHTINALTLQVSQLKIRNQSLLTKYSGLENQNNLLSNNVNTVSSLEKQISELKDQMCTLRSELMQAKSELNESLDKLLEVTQDLDAEERKSSELQKQLQIEKRLRKEAEIKLDRFEHSTQGVRRFSSDSLIDQKCKSLDSSVLHMLRKLRLILTRPHISDTSVDNISMTYESAMSNLSEIPLQNERALSDTSLSDSAENYLSVDLEKLKSFSSCHLEDSGNDEEFINYCKSMCNENLIQSDDENVTKPSKSLNERNKADEELLIEIDMLKSEINTVKLENQSYKTTIDELQKKLDDYNYSNLSDTEKIEKTENNSCIPNSFESLRMERINYLVLIEKLERDKETEQLKFNQLQEIHSRTCSELDEKIKEIQVLSKEQDNLSRTIESFNSRLEVQQIQISNQNHLKSRKILEDNDQQINEKLSVMHEVENYQEVIQQLNSEVCILKNTINDLNINNSEKDDQVRGLRALLRKEVENNENLKIMFEKEQDISSQARLMLENYQELIKKLKSEKLDCENSQSEIDILNKANNDLIILNSEKENRLHELYTDFWKNIESSDILNVVFQKEQDNSMEARLEVENYEKRIQQLIEQAQFNNLQSPLDPLKKTNNDLNALNTEKNNQLLELHAELRKKVESTENFKHLLEIEQNNCKQALLQLENNQKLIKQFESEKQQIDNLQTEIDILKKTNIDLNSLNSERDHQLLNLRAELKKNVGSKENFKILFEKEQNNYKQARLEVENYQKLIKQLNSEKRQMDNFQSEVDNMKKMTNDLNSLNSEKENQLVELRKELKKSVESNEHFKVLFEKEQNNYKQARLEIENYEKLIKQLNSEKQQIDDNFQSEVDIMKKINNDLNALNSEKENQLVELRTELKKSVESKEHFKVLFEKEQNNYKQGRLELENYEKLIKQLNSEKQQIDDNFQSEVDIMKNINNDLNALNSEKENQLVELRAELKKSVESKEHFKVLFEKEQNNYKKARLEIENYEKLIKQLNSEKQQIDDNFQSEVDIMKKINNDLNALNSEKENQLVELRAELKKNVESKENYKMLFEKERDDCGQIKLKVENCHILKQRECSILQSEIDNLKKINNDLNILNSEKDRHLRELRVEKRENIDNKENFRVLFENEQDNCKRARREVENCQNLIQTLRTEKRLLETLKDTNCKLLSQVDCLSLKNRDLIAEIEVKNHQIESLNLERDRNLKSIENFQKEQMKLKLEKDTLVQRLDILEKNNVGVADSTRNNQESIINKVYSELSKLKEILPKDESQNSHMREMLLYNRKCWNDNSKLHEINLLIDKVNVLVEERNLLKHQNSVGYEQLKQVHENMKREVEAEKRHNNVLIKKLENECQKLRDKNNTHKSEVEELRTSLTIIQTKQLNYKKQTENLSFENQNLVEKVKEMKNLQLNYKKIEQKLQYLVDENKTLAAKLYTKNKDVMNYETNEKKVEDLETENRKLTFKINQSENENRQLLECNTFLVEGRSKENNPGVLTNLNRNDEFIERKEFEILKTKYEQLKKRHESCNQQDSEIEYMIMCRKENKWKQQRTETHDSRRSIDLKTLCSESVVDTCNSCEDMSNQLHKTKSEISQLRKYIDSMSTSEFEVLKGKYETLKKLCRMRNDEISNLKQSLRQKK